MIETRFIPTWEELKKAKRVKYFNKFTGSPSETVSSKLLQRIFLYAAKHGEKVIFPYEWNRSENITRAQYEQWYSAYAKKTHFFEYHNGTRLFSDKRTLNLEAWNFIIEGEEED